MPECLAALPEDPVNGGPIDYTRESSEAYRLSCHDTRDTPGGISIGEVLGWPQGEWPSPMSSGPASAKTSNHRIEIAAC